MNKTIRDLVVQLCGRGQALGGVHVFTPHADIPDDFGSGPRLVVLPPDQFKAYSKANSKPAFDAAREILENRGEKPRLHRNRLLFLASDLNVIPRVIDQARTFLAWGEIVADIDDGRIDLGLFQAKQARNEKDVACQILKQELLECYRHVLVPIQGGQRETTFEVRKIGTGNSGGIATAVEKLLCEEQDIILNWSPILLKKLLEKSYFTNGRTEISLQQVWHDCCNYCQMPRLLNEEVFTRAVCDGVSKGDFFGYAMGKEGDKYLGFEYASPMFSLEVDQSALLIAKEVAEKYKAANISRPTPPLPAGVANTRTSPDTVAGGGNNSPVIKASSGMVPHRHFYGKIEFDPVESAGNRFQDIMTEVIQHFLLLEPQGVKVKLTLDISVEATAAPFDKNIERIVKENGNALGISGEFSET